jgi:peroxiredoxin
MKRFLTAWFSIPLLLICGPALASDPFFEAGVERNQVALAAPDFTLKVWEGKDLSLKDLKGKVVLLNFFEPWCPTCRKEAVSFDRLGKKWRGEEVVFLQVAVKVEEKDLRRIKKEWNLSLPILMDEGGSIAEACGVIGHPATLFIDQAGRIVGKSFGDKNWTSKSIAVLIQYLIASKTAQ